MWPPILRDAIEGHRALVVFALACVPFAIACAVLGIVDSRVIAGAPAWNKPLKFFVSVAIYTFTLAWYLGQWRRATGRRPPGWFWLGSAVLTALLVELVLISMQAIRGVTSHFNVATPLDAAVFNVMGLMILGLSVLHAILWVMLLRERWSDRARLSALRWGSGVTLIGLSVGALMVRPSAEQIALARAGSASASGAHAFGVPDGGPGLPLVNWSTEAGDRRVPHFVGMHALQVVPAVIVLAPAGWSQAALLLAVRATGVAWGAVVGLLILQAQQARPVLRPGMTLGVALAATVVAWAVTMLVARARNASPAPVPASS